MNVNPSAAPKISVSWTSAANPMSYVKTAAATVASWPLALVGGDDLRLHTWHGHSSRPATVHRLDVDVDADTRVTSKFHANSLVENPAPVSAPIGDARSAVDVLRSAIDRLGAPTDHGSEFQRAGEQTKLGNVRKHSLAEAIDGAERGTVAVAVTDAAGAINRWIVPADVGADVRAAAEALAKLA